MAFETVDVQSTLNGSSLVIGYRDDADEGDVVLLSLTATLGVTGVQWSLLGRPEGSAAGGSVVPADLGTALTATFTVDADDGAFLKDGTYIVQATLNPGAPSETRKTIIVARLSGLTVAGDPDPLTLRMPGGFEALEDTSDPLRRQGWATQVLRWFRYFRRQAAAGGPSFALSVGWDKRAAPYQNAVASALTLGGEGYEDLDKYGTTLDVNLSAIGKIAAANFSGGWALWASATENDLTAGGTLLALLLVPIAGTAAAFKGYASRFSVANPGGKRYIILTSFAGAMNPESDVGAKQLDWFGATASVRNQV